MDGTEDLDYTDFKRVSEYRKEIEGGQGAGCYDGGLGRIIRLSALLLFRSLGTGWLGSVLLAFEMGEFGDGDGHGE